MDALGAPSVDVLGPNPVVLAAVKDVAHLVRTDGVHVFIVATDFFPLKDREGTRTGISTQYSVEEEVQQYSCETCL